MPALQWRPPRSASLLRLAVLAPRVVRSYAAPTAAMLLSRGVSDYAAGLPGSEPPETEPGSAGASGSLPLPSLV